MSAMLQTTQMLRPLIVAVIGSMEDKEAELYGCFFPRVGDNSSMLSASSPVLPTTEGEFIDVLVAPVIQIMPELRELMSEPYFASVSGAFVGGLIGDLM